MEPFKLEQFFSLHEHSAKYLLCSSDCESFNIGELLEMSPGISDSLFSLRLGYTTKEGNTGLREAICGLYQTLNPNQIVVCAGAQEAIYLFCESYLNKGDDVIFQFPCYQPLETLPRTFGCHVSQWNVRYEGIRPFFGNNT